MKAEESNTTDTEFRCKSICVLAAHILKYETLCVLNAPPQLQSAVIDLISKDLDIIGSLDSDQLRSALEKRLFNEYSYEFDTAKCTNCNLSWECETFGSGAGYDYDAALRCSRYAINTDLFDLKQSIIAPLVETLGRQFGINCDVTEQRLLKLMDSFASKHSKI